jgi:PPOX class probable F420-dependent enzyme
VIGSPDQDAFISKSVLSVLTTLRRDGSPASSMVTFARLGDELFVSTTRDRLKGKYLMHDPRLALTVINPDSRLNFVTIEGVADIEEADQDRYNRAIAEANAAHGLPWVGETLHAILGAPGRFIVRIRPRRVYGETRNSRG